MGGRQGRKAGWGGRPPTRHVSGHYGQEGGEREKEEGEKERRRDRASSHTGSHTTGRVPATQVSSLLFSSTPPTYYIHSSHVLNLFKPYCPLT